MPISRYEENVTASYVLEIEPKAILIRMRVDISWWHIIDVDRELTWCGLVLSQGSERRPLSDTPENRHCETCEHQLEAMSRPSLI